MRKKKHDFCIFFSFSYTISTQIFHLCLSPAPMAPTVSDTLSSFLMGFLQDMILNNSSFKSTFLSGLEIAFVFFA